MNNVWEFLAGLGILLFSMALLESSLRKMAGRSFKLFLRKYTSSVWGALLCGMLVTTLLQSSSLVILMTLAFVSAGAINMRNAFVVVLGANIGTTISSLILATIGFKLQLEALSYPLMALSAPGIAFIRYNKRLYYAALFFFAFGLLFLGLGLIRESLIGYIEVTKLKAGGDQTLVLFTLAGLVSTIFIQSSSAIMVVALSALDSGAISFLSAAAVVIGAEVGTAVKFYIGHRGNSADRNRITTGNILFNVLIATASFLLLPQLSFIAANMPGVDSPLLALVIFQIVINVGGVVLIFPFINWFTKYLKKLYVASNQQAVHFLSENLVFVTEEASVAFKREIRLFVLRAAKVNLLAFHIREPIVIGSVEEEQLIAVRDGKAQTFLDRYELLKQAEGEILAFYLKLAQARKEEESDETPTGEKELVEAVQNAMYSAKGMKDIIHNRRDLRSSADDEMYDQYKFFKQQLREFYSRFNHILSVPEGERGQLLVALYKKATSDFENRLRIIYELGEKGDIAEKDIANLLNVSREVYSSCKAMVRALNGLSGNIKLYE